MEDTINRLDEQGLISMWNDTFPDWSFNEFRDEIADLNDENRLKTIRDTIITVLRVNERARDKLMKDIMDEPYIYEDSINKLNERELERMWNDTFPDWSFDEFREELADLNDDDRLKLIRDTIMTQLKWKKTQQNKHTIAALSKDRREHQCCLRRSCLLILPSADLWNLISFLSFRTKSPMVRIGPVNDPNFLP